MVTLSLMSKKVACFKMQLKFPKEALTFPKGQSLHSLEPAASLNFPGPQNEHDSAEAPEYEPTVQTWQVPADWFKARDFPGSQAVQDVAPVVRSVLDPTAQDKQASTSEVGAKVPVGQMTQDRSAATNCPGLH